MSLPKKFVSSLPLASILSLLIGPHPDSRLLIGSPIPIDSLRAWLFSASVLFASFCALVALHFFFFRGEELTLSRLLPTLHRIPRQHHLLIRKNIIMGQNVGPSWNESEKFYVNENYVFNQEVEMMEIRKVQQHIRCIPLVRLDGVPLDRFKRANKHVEKVW
jgi:hypothetical protein